jgi:hypothetical protein
MGPLHDLVNYFRRARGCIRERWRRLVLIILQLGDVNIGDEEVCTGRSLSKACIRVCNAKAR